MAIRCILAVLCWLLPIVFGQTAKPAGGRATIVQPGAPGKPSKTLSPAAAAKRRQLPSESDVSFMQGMIHHHAQAVEMVALLRTRGLSKDLLAFGERITISQSDEIKFMKMWLEDFGKPVVPAHDHAAHLGEGMPMMPGMLTAQQMADLAKAKGREFDRLFLTGMIQHHTGAL